MPFVLEVTSYQVFYSGNPRIVLTNANRGVFGQLMFFPNGTLLQPDLQSPNGQVELHYHLDDFSSVIDILRNEKPVFLNFSGAGPGFANFIQTGPEPVGEGE
jgi:hypothetical protein